MKYAHIFYTFHAFWQTFCIEGVYRNLWSECSFFENWVIEGYVLFCDINEFLPILPTFFMKFTTVGLHMYCCWAYMTSMKISSVKTILFLWT